MRLQSVQLTNSEVEEFLQELSAKHSTQITTANVLDYLSEDNKVYVMKSQEKINGQWEEVLLFFKEMPYDG